MEKAFSIDNAIHIPKLSDEYLCVHLQHADKSTKEAWATQASRYLTIRGNKSRFH